MPTLLEDAIRALQENTLVTLDFKELGLTAKTLVGNTNAVSSLVVLPNGKLASGSSNNTITIWDVETNQCLQSLTGHTDIVRLLVVLPDGQLASGSDDATIRIWNIATGQCMQILKHGMKVTSLVSLSNGRNCIGKW